MSEQQTGAVNDLASQEAPPTAREVAKELWLATRKTAMRVVRVAAILLVAAILIASGVLAGQLAWRYGFKLDVIMSWFVPWTMTAGFAGMLALIAAAIAFYGQHRVSAVNRENATRKEWWDRTKWCLDLITGDKPLARETALLAVVGQLNEGTTSERRMLLPFLEGMESADQSSEAFDIHDPAATAATEEPPTFDRPAASGENDPVTISADGRRMRARHRIAGHRTRRRHQQDGEQHD